MGKLIDNPASEHSTQPSAMKWTKSRYLRAAETGAFDGVKCYLFRGEVIEMSPMGFGHGFGIGNLGRVLYRLFSSPWVVRLQTPFETPGESVPHPDGMVLSASAALRQPQPNEAVLIVEVADSSRAIDRKKAKEYAAAQVPEYWILDVIDRRLEVYRNPRPDPTEPLGFTYDPPTFVEETGSVQPLAMPSAEVKVAELLPPKTA
jgi:Uma2 family endonuclease